MRALSGPISVSITKRKSGEGICPNCHHQLLAAMFPPVAFFWLLGLVPKMVRGLSPFPRQPLLYGVALR